MRPLLIVQIFTSVEIIGLLQRQHSFNLRLPCSNTIFDAQISILKWTQNLVLLLKTRRSKTGSGFLFLPQTGLSLISHEYAGHGHIFLLLIWSILFKFLVRGKETTQWLCDHRLLHACVNYVRRIGVVRFIQIQSFLRIRYGILPEIVFQIFPVKRLNHGVIRTLHSLRLLAWSFF